MDGSSNNAYELGQSIGDAIGSAIVLLWVILIVVGVLFVVLLVWFIWIMTRIKQENVKTNKLLNDFMKIVSRIGAIICPIASSNSLSSILFTSLHQNTTPLVDLQGLFPVLILLHSLFPFPYKKKCNQ